ncbi:MAG: hypothetical protein ACRDHP_01570 [Ktedonobacterales bacterium]
MWAAILLLVILWFLPGAWVIGFHIRNRRRRASSGGSSGECALAEERSTALLRDLLDEREYEQLKHHGYVDIASPSCEERIYRIPRIAGRVRVYEHGHALVELCVQPAVPLPANDVIVLHKLMIEGNEQGYLARANEIPLTLPPHFYGLPWWFFPAH